MQSISMAGLLALKQKLGVNLNPQSLSSKAAVEDELDVRTWRIEALDKPDDDSQLMNQLARICRKGLKKMGIQNLFPVQRVVVPAVINAFSCPTPNDFAICVPTGQGKTLAYLLPLFHCVSSRQHIVTRAVVLVPTRDLAKQVAAVAEVFARSSKTSSLRVACLTGQSAIVSSPVSADIVIATPGRLCDAVASGMLKTEALDFLVLDEADRLMIANPDNQRWQAVLGQQLHADSHCVKLLFSATMTKNPLKLSSLALRRLVRIEQTENLKPLAVPNQDTSESRVVDHRFVKAHDDNQKIHKLVKLLQDLKPKKSLVFVNSVARVKELVNQLACPEILFKPFDAHLAQVDRDRTLQEFSGKHELPVVLVCSDLATRGLDLPSVDLVLNFDLPSYLTAYIHRAGRTGRAGKGGLVVSLVHKKEAPFFRAGLVQKLKEEHNIRIKSFP